MQSIETNIKNRIMGTGKGSLFTPMNFLDLGGRAAVDKALSRLAADATIRRLARGLYDYPKEHPTLGLLQPKPDEIAKALAKRDAVRVQPAGAYAANLLGLSEQVPTKIVFLTDGVSRTIKVGSTEITLKQTTPRNMATAGRLSGLLIQAFRYLGKEHIKPEHIAHLNRTIPAEERSKLLQDLRYAPTWMHSIFRELAEKKDEL